MSFLAALVLHLGLCAPSAKAQLAPQPQPDPDKFETLFFDIRPANFKVSNSLYRTVDFLDSRWDTSLIGITRTGAFRSNDAKLVLRSPVQPQLQTLLSSLLDSRAAAGELLFQLRDFNFIEKEGIRYCYFTATLYSQIAHRYQKLSTLDTLVITYGTKITKTLETDINDILSRFMANTLLQQAEDSTSYDIAQVRNIDSIEKSRLPLFNIAANINSVSTISGSGAATTGYTDGIYLSYASFSKQQPELRGIVDAKKKGGISAVWKMDAGGKKIRLKPADIYAVVYKGRPYIATPYDYYSLEFVSGNLFFTGDVRVVASNQDELAAGVTTGIIGALADLKGNRTTYEMIIDHLTGRFVHLTFIKRLEPETIMY